MGWFDAVMTRYACRINGVTELALTNLDGLDSVKTIKVCTAYRLNGKRLSTPPADINALSLVEPVYQTFKGWQQDTTGCTRYRDLPVQARAYLDALCELNETSLGIVSVGPRRDQTLKKSS